MTPDDNARLDENLRLLSVFHYVWAGMGVLGLTFIALHYMVMAPMFDPAFLAAAKDPPPPEMHRFLSVFKWFYLVFAIYGIATMTINVLAAKWLRERRHWMFCAIVAGVNCISFPLGTLLGVFTLVALTKAEVRRTFAGQAHAA